MADPFAKRLRRAEFLQKEWPFASELLRFYGRIYHLQRQILDDLNAVPYPDAKPLVAHMNPFLELVIREGPEELAARARKMFGNLGPLLAKFTHGDPPEDAVLLFFPRVLHQPVLMSSQIRQPSSPAAGEAQGHCPWCKGLPQVSVLREDKSAETVRRSFVCSMCFQEWEFPRVLCPGCKEEKPEKLPRYTAQEIPWMRVEACDTCRKYIKSVDLTLNWDADPVVDELASTPLDVIARDHGYSKIAPNLAGI